MKLVIGSTGYLGGMVVRGLQTAGEKVRVLVREGANQQPLRDAGAQIFSGNLHDKTSLKTACQGVDAIISTASTRTMDYSESVGEEDVRGYENLISAAFEGGVGHFIFISAMGADPLSPIPYLAAKGRIETVLRASGMDYTIFRPSYFMEFWFMGMVLGPASNHQPVWVTGSGYQPHWPVTAADVAAIAVKAANSSVHRNRMYLLPGPEPLSLRDAAAEAGLILGKQVDVQTFAPASPPPDVSPLTAQLLSLKFDLQPYEAFRAADDFKIEMLSLIHI